MSEYPRNPQVTHDSAPDPPVVLPPSPTEQREDAILAALDELPPIRHTDPERYHILVAARAREIAGEYFDCVTDPSLADSLALQTAAADLDRVLSDAEGDAAQPSRRVLGAVRTRAWSRLALATAAGRDRFVMRLIRDHQDALIRLAVAITREPEAAADAVATVVERLLRRLAEQPEHIIAWPYAYLWAMVKHAARDARRAESRQEARAERYASEPLAADEDSTDPYRTPPEIIALLNEERAWVSAMLRAVVEPEEQGRDAEERAHRDATILALYYVEGLTHEQIARRCGLTKEAVHNRHRVLIPMLRRLCTPQPIRAAFSQLQAGQRALLRPYFGQHTRLAPYSVTATALSTPLRARDRHALIDFLGTLMDAYVGFRVTYESGLPRSAATQFRTRLRLLPNYTAAWGASPATVLMVALLVDYVGFVRHATVHDTLARRFPGRRRAAFSGYFRGERQEEIARGLNAVQAVVPESAEEQREAFAEVWRKIPAAVDRILKEALREEGIRP